MSEQMDDYRYLRGNGDFQEHFRRKMRRDKRLRENGHHKPAKYRAEDPSANQSDEQEVVAAETAYAWENIDEQTLSPYALQLMEKLKRSGIIAKSDKFDQHFLIDTSAINSIVEAATISQGDSVLEIGPGPGNLTERIWQICRDVRANLATIEIDESFRPLLQELPDSQEIDMRWGDAIAQMPTVVQQNRITKIVANIPYSILEPLLRHIHSSRSIESAVLLVGKRYADRSMADFHDEDPKGERFSKTSLFSQARFHPQIVTEIPRESFLPPPRTESAVVRLNQRKGKNPDLLTVANALIKKPMMQVRSLVLNLLQQKFDKGKLSQIRTLEDAQEMRGAVPPRVDQLGFPEEVLNSPIGTLTNDRLQALLIKCDVLRKRRKAEEEYSEYEDNDE